MKQECEIESKVVHFKIKCPACQTALEIEEMWINQITTAEDEFCHVCDKGFKISALVTIDVEVEFLEASE